MKVSELEGGWILDKHANSALKELEDLMGSELKPMERQLFRVAFGYGLRAASKGELLKELDKCIEQS